MAQAKRRWLTEQLRKGRDGSNILTDKMQWYNPNNRSLDRYDDAGKLRKIKDTTKTDQMKTQRTPVIFGKNQGTSVKPVKWGGKGIA